ncbi:ankyrin [Hypoxylon sp. NC0597]|nr:ankyrin [Hypoxylon sp. NC0597]
MDPLSAAASIITLVQATVGIAKGVQFLRSLGQIPLEFVVLVNELSTLQAAAEQVKTALTDFEGQSQEKRLDASFPELDPSILISLKDDLAHIVDELNALCNRLKKSGGDNKATGQPRKEHISTLRWQKEKSNIAKLKQKAQNTRGYLSLCFTVLNSSQLYRQTKLTFHIKEVVCTSARVHEENHALLEALHGSINQLNDNLVNREQALTANQPVNELNAENTHPETVTKQPNMTPMVYFEAALTYGCPSFCSCNCHRLQSSRSPTWLSSAIGRLFAQYNAIPLFQRPRCDASTCRLKSIPSFRLCYTFPQWLLARQIEFGISWSSVTGAGSSLHLRIPRVIDIQQVITAVHYCDIHWLRNRMAEKSILPTDVDDRGRTLLNIALEYCRFEVAQFLVEQGCDTQSRDMFNRTTTSLARTLLYEYDDWGPWKNFLYKLSVRHERDEAVLSTNIHRAILHPSEEPLSATINQCLYDIDSLDGWGYAPLHWAVTRNDSVAVKMLLRAGANPNILSTLGTSPLQEVASSGNIVIAQLLLDAGANVNLFNPVWMGTPVLYAFGNPKMLRLLADHGACLIYKGRYYDVTPLDIATRTYQNRSDNSKDRASWKESLDYLISAGVDINNQWHLGQENPIMWALLHRNALLLDLLIEAGARLDLVDSDGFGILHYAALRTQIESIEVLRRANISGIDPDMPEKYGRTALMILNWRKSKPEHKFLAGERRITDDETQAFEKLLDEIRERNKEKKLLDLANRNTDDRTRELDTEPVDFSRDKSSVGISSGGAKQEGRQRRGSICTESESESESSDADEFFDFEDD